MGIHLYKGTCTQTKNKESIFDIYSFHHRGLLFPIYSFINAFKRHFLRLNEQAVELHVTGTMENPKLYVLSIYLSLPLKYGSSRPAPRNANKENHYVSFISRP